MLSTKADISDMFCGVGGSTLGAKLAGATGRLGMNHWQIAVDSHNANHPEMDHFCGDVFTADPRYFPSTMFLLASPECTTHSIAGGKKRKEKIPGLFHHPDPRTVRSRATMWDVVRFAEVHRYQFVIVENVIDIKYWEPFDTWLMAMNSLGYESQTVYLNSMFFPPTPQSRDRIYIVFWRRGNPKPQLDFRPPAWCPRCEKNVEAIQSWKNQKRKWGRYGNEKHGQYVYRCQSCASVVHPYYFAAANAIDWSLPIIKIGERHLHKLPPLKPRTLERIEIGLKRYAGRYLMVPLDYTHGHNNRARPLTDPFRTQTAASTMGLAGVPMAIQTSYDGQRPPRAVTEPLFTQTARQDLALAVPPAFLTSVNYFADNTRPVDEPMPTQTTGSKMGLVTIPAVMTMRGDGDVGRHPIRPVEAPLSTVIASATQQYLIQAPFLTSYYGRKDASSAIDRPLPTVTAEPRHALVAAPFLAVLYGTSDVQEIDQPVGTITAGGINYALVQQPFLMSYYGNKPGYASPHDPISTVRTVQAHALIAPDRIPDVEECGFRMFTPAEILAAMAFPPGYVVFGNKRDQVRQAGNAVTPPVMTWLVQACLDTLN